MPPWPILARMRKCPMELGRFIDAPNFRYRITHVRGAAGILAQWEGRCQLFACFEKCLRILAISPLDGGQSVSQVLQWNTKVSDFSACSNSSRSKVTV